MKKWRKAMLSLLSIGYLIGLAIMLWPRIIVTIMAVLERMNLNIAITSQTIVEYYGMTLIVITLIILLGILLAPSQKADIPLSQTKRGRLALSNTGVSHFIQTQLSGEGLSNIKVTIKNTRHQKLFHIVADSVYQQYAITELPRLTNTLTDKITDLLAGVNTVPIKVNMKINQATSDKRKAARVI
ncbi:alkaline shock response membrane anchor protein AmaP [uncultured Leuconostoc sp.]|uniref:alkaline shock response membrane anchor protein AmaP n=1 Tax=uncultured Leuconostoc sp. TaxID=173262 RepID=UPI0025EFEB66|nr:alkaline shock response membrane anchor protein AmaP [uncultured Leuconostoc sp.]